MKEQYITRKEIFSTYFLNFKSLSLYSFKARVALRTASTITPTSAKMASHMPAIPSAPKIRQIAFIARANTMFSLTIFNVFKEIFIAREIIGRVIIHQNDIRCFNRRIGTRAPIAIPISARERTGASLIPSPTKASFSFVFF